MRTQANVKPPRGHLARTHPISVSDRGTASFACVPGAHILSQAATAERTRVVPDQPRGLPPPTEGHGQPQLPRLHGMEVHIFHAAARFAREAGAMEVLDVTRVHVEQVEGTLLPGLKEMVTPSMWVVATVNSGGSSRPEEAGAFADNERRFPASPGPAPAGVAALIWAAKPTRSPATEWRSYGSSPPLT